MLKAKGKKVLKITLLIIGILILLIAIVAGFFWNKYVNKNNALKCFETQNNQQVYFLGTMHDYHFNKAFNYSMEDILSVVENTKPDVVFLEAREQYWDDYGVIDGPIEMSVVYSYCIQNNIKVEMVDAWNVDEDYLSRNTAVYKDCRNDQIFININKKLTSISDNSRILIVFGRGHLDGQSKRFVDNGYKKIAIKNKSELFKSNHDFTYPEATSTTWDKRAYFYAYTYPDIISNTEGLSQEIKSQFTGGNKEKFYLQQLDYCKMFSDNKLYK